MIPPFWHPVKDSLSGGQRDLLSAQLISQGEPGQLNVLADGDSWVCPITTLVQQGYLFKIRFGLLFRRRETLWSFPLLVPGKLQIETQKKINSPWALCDQLGVLEILWCLAEASLFLNYQLRPCSRCPRLYQNSLVTLSNYFSHSNVSLSATSCRRQTKLYSRSISQCVCDYSLHVFQFNLFSPSFHSRVERLLVVSMYHCDLAEAHARFTQLRSNSELVSDSFLWNLWILFPPNNVCVSGRKYSKCFFLRGNAKTTSQFVRSPPSKGWKSDSLWPLATPIWTGAALSRVCSG